VLKAARINDNEEFTIMVPLFCNIGEKIEIDTRTDEYKSRAK
jgi:elongation factor P